MEKNIVYHSYNMAAVRDLRIASVSQQMFGIYHKIIFLLLNKLSVFVFLFSLTSPDYEIQRQIDVLQRGGTVKNETRAYDSKSG